MMLLQDRLSTIDIQFLFRNDATTSGANISGKGSGKHFVIKTSAKEVES